MKTAITIFAGLCLFTGTVSAEPGIQRAIIEAAGPDMPRADTASVAERADGTLMVVYQKYEPSKRAGDDLAKCRIWSKTSKDGGLHWGEGRMLVDIAPGDLNVGIPALLRTASGDLLLICLRVHSGSSTTECLFHSRDGGRTFVEEPPVWKHSEGAWLQGGAGSLVELQSGRLLLPTHGGSGEKSGQNNSAWCFLSDDQGKSWHRSRTRVELPKRGAMEASVSQLADGTLVMSLRTQLGGPYISRSSDQGDTWSEARPSGLESGESCTCLRRIPGTDNLVLFWNNSKYIAKGHHHYGERTPLTAAVSRDGGKTWRVVGNLADDPQAEYTNLGCTFTREAKAVVTYMAGKPAWNRDHISLEAAIVDAVWLKGEDKANRR
jgi:sialidase-1